MAFKKVNSGGTLIRSATLEVGNSITGYVTGFPTFTPKQRSEGEEVRVQTNISMTLAEEYTGLIGSEANEQELTLPKGTQVTVGSSGNIGFILQDGLVKSGFLTRITKIANKSGKKGAKFEIEQDEERELSDAAFDKVEAADLNGVKKALNANAQKADKTAGIRKKLLEDQGA